LYIFSPLAPKRIAELIPDVKMIAVLRNPTERAISHYFHECRMGRETLPIVEALQAEEERLRPFIANEDYRHTIFIHHSYKSRGRYKEQISRYLEYFSREQILILKSDDLFSKADEVLRQVFAFIGVNSDFQITDLEARNISPNRTKVDDEVYQYLDHYFLPHNQALNELVGQDFGWDKPR